VEKQPSLTFVSSDLRTIPQKRFLPPCPSWRICHRLFFFFFVTCTHARKIDNRNCLSPVNSSQHLELESTVMGFDICSCSPRLAFWLSGCCHCAAKPVLLFFVIPACRDESVVDFPELVSSSSSAIYAIVLTHCNGPGPGSRILIQDDTCSWKGQSWGLSFDIY
jgi:hypothetical protein